MDSKCIRSIAICLFRNDSRILLSEGFDASARDSFYRPLGGGIEHGERSRDAVLREIQEEIGVEVKNLELLHVLENIFWYEGRQGHEIIFVYDAEFTDRSLYERNEIHGYRQETDDHFVAKWRSIEELEQAHIKLVPQGLADLMAALQ